MALRKFVTVFALFVSTTSRAQDNRTFYPIDFKFETIDQCNEHTADAAKNFARNAETTVVNSFCVKYHRSFGIVLQTPKAVDVFRSQTYRHFVGTYNSPHIGSYSGIAYDRGSNTIVTGHLSFVYYPTVTVTATPSSEECNENLKNYLQSFEARTYIFSFCESTEGPGGVQWSYVIQDYIRGEPQP